MKVRGEVLGEKLDFESQRGKQMLFAARFVHDRASAQVSAVGGLRVFLCCLIIARLRC